MNSMALNIKNMVCNRCIKVVQEELEKLGYGVHVERLGKVHIEYSGNGPNMAAIKQSLIKNSFEILVEKSAKLIENVKTSLIDLIYSDKLETLNVNLSDYLARQLHHDYPYISNLFSSVEGITIEKYLILQKIERVKELLIYNELTLSETSFKLGYSSVQHLSNQFKKTTGMSPSHFKSLHGRVRQALDKIGSK